MAETPTVALSKEADKPPISRRKQLLEMALVFSFIIPNAIVGITSTRLDIYPFTKHAWLIITRCLPLLALIFYFLHHNGESYRTIGWRFRLLDVVIGLGIFIPYYSLGWFSTIFFWKLGLHYPLGRSLHLPMPSGESEILLAVVMLAIVAVSEETLYRGYLFLRLKNMQFRPLFIVGISALLFAIQHIYQGPLGVANTLTAGILLGFIYLWRKNLIIPILLHLCWDLTAFHVIPTTLFRQLLHLLGVI